jgi:hypothetical protein
VEDPPRQIVATLGEVGLGFDLAPIRFIVGQPQHVQGLKIRPKCATARPSEVGCP